MQFNIRLASLSLLFLRRVMETYGASSLLSPILIFYVAYSSVGDHPPNYLTQYWCAYLFTRVLPLLFLSISPCPVRPPVILSQPGRRPQYWVNLSKHQPFTQCWFDVGRRWSNIKLALGNYFMLTGMSVMYLLRDSQYLSVQLQNPITTCVITKYLSTQINNPETTCVNNPICQHCYIIW